MKVYEHSRDFEKCEICNCNVGKVEFDSPLYCEKCMKDMEKMDMSPKRYKKFLELAETMKKRK